MIRKLKKSLFKPSRKPILPKSKTFLVGILWALIFSIFFPPIGFARSQNFDFDFIRSEDVPGFFAVKIYPIPDNTNHLEDFLLEDISIEVSGGTEIFPQIIQKSENGEALLFVGKFLKPEKSEIVMTARDSDGIFSTHSTLDFDIDTQNDWGWDLVDIWEYQSGNIQPITDPKKIQRQKDLINLFPLILVFCGFLLIVLAFFFRSGNSTKEPSGRENKKTFVPSSSQSHYADLDTEIPEAFWHQSKHDVGEVVEKKLSFSNADTFLSEPAILKNKKVQERNQVLNSVNKDQEELNKEILNEKNNYLHPEEVPEKSFQKNSRKNIEDPFFVEVIEKK